MNWTPNSDGTYTKMFDANGNEIQLEQLNYALQQFRDKVVSDRLTHGPSFQGTLKGWDEHWITLERTLTNGEIHPVVLNRLQVLSIIPE